MQKATFRMHLQEGGETVSLQGKIQTKAINVGALVLAPMAQARIIKTLTEGENLATNPLIKKGFNDALCQYQTLRNGQVKEVLLVDDILGLCAETEKKLIEYKRKLQEFSTEFRNSPICSFDEDDLAYVSKGEVRRLVKMLEALET